MLMSTPRPFGLAHIYASATCGYCGMNAAVMMDHVVPRCRLTRDERSAMGDGNKVPACRTCNSSKGARTPAEWAASVVHRLTVGEAVAPTTARAAWRLVCPGAWLR